MNKIFFKYFRCHNDPESKNVFEKKNIQINSRRKGSNNKLIEMITDQSRK